MVFLKKFIFIFILVVICIFPLIVFASETLVMDSDYIADKLNVLDLSDPILYGEHFKVVVSSYPCKISFRSSGSSLKTVDIGESKVYAHVNDFLSSYDILSVHLNPYSDSMPGGNVKIYKVVYPQMVSGLYIISNERTYTVYWDSQGEGISYDVEINGSVVTNTSRNSYIVTDCGPGQYSVRVRAFDGDTTGAWSEVALANPTKGNLVRGVMKGSLYGTLLPGMSQTVSTVLRIALLILACLLLVMLLVRVFRRWVTW